MTAGVLIGRLLLFGVLALAGLTKLADRTGAQEAVRSFGVPTRFATPLAGAIPLAELAAAALLLPAATARIGAAAALVLLLGFTAAVGLALARGREPECHCFGQLRAARVGSGTLARNLALAAIAAFVLLGGPHDGGPSAIAWVGNLSSAAVVGLACGGVIAIMLAFQGWFLLRLLRQNGRLIERLEALERHSGVHGSAGPPTGSSDTQLAAALSLGDSAPRFTLPSLDGTTVTVSDFAGRWVLVLFWNPGCGFCQRMLHELRAWEDNRPDDRPELVLIAAGSAEANRRMRLQSQVLLDQGGGTMRVYGARGTPMAVLVDDRGRIASGLLAGADAVMAAAWGEQDDLAIARSG